MKKTFILIVTLLAFSFAVQAQKTFELPLWEGSQVKDDAADARIYVHLANNPTGQAIIICPGGAYAGLAIDNEGHEIVVLHLQVI